MKLNHIALLTAALAATALCSCDDDDDYKAGRPANAAGQNIYFSAETDEVANIGLDDSVYVVLLERDTLLDQELTVPVTAPGVDKSVFTVPASAHFAAGEKQAALRIALSDKMESFRPYTLRLALPESLTDPYAETDVYPVFNGTLTKEDYQVVATGTYNEPILFEDSWEQNLEYSPMRKNFRLPDLIVRGTGFYFKWNGKAGDDCQFSFCNEDGSQPVTKIATGYVHSSYGMIYAEVLDGNFIGFDAYTDEETGQDVEEFEFPFDYNCDAGSFGSNYETFVIDQWYSKPWED